MIEIRWIHASDMPRVMEIERETFRHPWEEDHFRICLRAKNHVGIVAVIDGTVVGYCLYSKEYDKRTVVSISVCPKHQRKGIGRMFLDEMKKGHTAEIMVADSNVGTHHFLKACGFRAIEVVRDFFDYEDYTEDAYVFRHISGKLAAEPDLQCQGK